MGLLPLEFSDCLRDSPYFRETLHAHEKELERTSKAIKGLINECKELILAAKSLSKAQRNFSNTLIHFKFDPIGGEQTDDEIVICESLKEFGKLISGIEDERDRMLERAYDQIIHPLEAFRKEQIGGAKEGKKKFDKETAKFCQSLDRYLNLKNKCSDGTLQEADAALEMEGRHFYQASMEYVLLLQEVHERKKFEFVETLLGFMYGWLTFYHQGHEVATDMRPYMQDLQCKLQKCRENFATAHEEAEQLMHKMLEVRGTKPPTDNRSPTKEGYLYVMEKKALGTTWTKYYCQYQKQNHILTMIPYNQTAGKGISTETMVLTSCTRRASDSIDKRFCFDITVQDRSGPLTLQALSEDDRRSWLDAMDGKEPIYNQPSTNSDQRDSSLDDVGFAFIRRCITSIEHRGLSDQGLYRVVGVNSKVNKLTAMGLDRRKMDKLNLDDPSEWEVKTITSALKNYFRSLPEPLMTFKLNPSFIAAAKQESKTLRVNDVHELIHKLPQANFKMLELLMKHLRKVADNSLVNLMNVSNIGVCFGPTLMRPQEETIAAIMDIKFCNIVVEILIDNYDTIFHQVPDGVTDISKCSKPANPPKPAPPPTKPAIRPQNHVAVKAATQQTIAKVASQTASAPASTTTTPTGAEHPAPMHNSAIGLPSGPASAPPVDSKVNIHKRKGSNSSITSGGGVTTPNSGGFSYSNLTSSMSNHSSANSQTYAQVRAKLRPTGGFYSQFSPVLLTPRPSRHGSKNREDQGGGVTNQGNQIGRDNWVKGVRMESMEDHPSSTSSSSESLNSKTNSNPSLAAQRGGPTYGNIHGIGRHSQLPSTSSTSSKTDPAPGGGFSYPSYRKRCSADSITFSISSSTSSISSLSSGKHGGRRVRTLYACEAENDSEMSFEPNQIINNVRQSREPGWLEGIMDGKTGLIPANYVEFLN